MNFLIPRLLQAGDWSEGLWEWLLYLDFPQKYAPQRLLQTAEAQDISLEHI